MTSSFLRLNSKAHLKQEDFDCPQTQSTLSMYDDNRDSQTYSSLSTARFQLLLAEKEPWLTLCRPATHHAQAHAKELWAASRAKCSHEVWQHRLSLLAPDQDDRGLLWATSDLFIEVIHDQLCSGWVEGGKCQSSYSFGVGIYMQSCQAQEASPNQLWDAYRQHAHATLSLQAPSAELVCAMLKTGIAKRSRLDQQ